MDLLSSVEIKWADGGSVSELERTSANVLGVNATGLNLSLEALLRERPDKRRERLWAVNGPKSLSPLEVLPSPIALRHCNVTF